MKNISILLIFFFGSVIQTIAQDNKLTTLTTIGITSPILDNGIGLYLGVNPNFQITERLTAECQISYSFTKIGSSFLKGDKGFFNSVNTLAGGRLYINREDAKARFYFNLLIGLNYLKEKENNINKEGEFNIGYSGGIFMDISKVTVGLSYDTPQNLILKLGYSF